MKSGTELKPGPVVEASSGCPAAEIWCSTFIAPRLCLGELQYVAEPESCMFHTRTQSLRHETPVAGEETSSILGHLATRPIQNKDEGTFNLNLHNHIVSGDRLTGKLSSISNPGKSEKIVVSLQLLLSLVC